MTIRARDAMMASSAALEGSGSRKMTNEVVAEVWVQAAPSWWRRVVLRQAWEKPRTVMWLTRGGDWIVSSAANAEEIATATDLVMRETS